MVRELKEEIKMGFGFNTDLNTLSALTTSSLMDPSNDTDIALRMFNSSLNANINGSYLGNNNVNEPIFNTDANGNQTLNQTTASMAKYASIFNPNQLGSILSSAFITPADSYNTDATNTLTGLDIGMDSFLAKMWTMLNSYSTGSSNLNLGINIPGSSNSSKGSAAISGNAPINSSDSFERKLKLIDEYCAKTNKDIDTDAIRTKYSM